MKKTAGIHHITAIVGNPQQNVDFYASILGLRLVKKTVNFDDPGTYHLYFGDEDGSPGTAITFFPWDEGHRGKVGDGQVGLTSFVIPKGAMAFWESRLAQFKVVFSKAVRFGEQSLQFHDPDGIALELVEREEGKTSTWQFAGVTADTAIKGFGGAVLRSIQPQQTTRLLEKVMGFARIGEEDGYIRFQSEADLGNVIDVVKTPSERGRMGVGTVHHIAFRVEDDSDQLEWKQYLEANGLGVTPVQDRNYFYSIYFREFGGILFEMATDVPGFAIDEPKEKLGENLMLPPQYEELRPQLEKILLPITVRTRD
ncbi:ring-cleaving dioxygenase [Sporolactobacillus sp. STSJ-5]|uniref:ring-cleaving dioxygenase n=1 Tax=Sporolactobacillus sp. STSJ-5 TaxID=2965076 RepID=UPI002102E329|nr:ring-cleaving dioxygenase [Sporolactobacillus sp. STSJ-5]MCQ2010162.1 ring-cleaving dioxygenase [Sporolactobacillus sp. STSJ-5]